MSDITWGGTLVTAGDVVFSGGREGYVLALDARSGKLLWRASVGGQVNAGAMSYAVNGKQYVAIAGRQRALRRTRCRKRLKPQPRT
jgi:glucose dehydrogenase